MDRKYTVGELAKELKVSKRTILREIDRGKLTVEKVGRRYLISQSIVDSYLGTSLKQHVNDLDAFFKDRESDMVSLLQRLVSAGDSGSDFDKEKRTAKIIVDFLQRQGIRSVLAIEGEVVVVRATYGFRKDGILLDCPLDTVDVGDGSKWSYPPFDGIVKDGKLYGRGASDAKGGMIAMIYTLLALKQFVDEDEVRVEMVFDGGEQDGRFEGMKLALKRGLDVSLGIVGYGGDQDELPVGARGYHRYTFMTEGEAVHTGSRFRKCINAISNMMRFLIAIEETEIPSSSSSPTS